MDESGPKPSDLEVLPDAAYALRAVKDLAVGLLAAMAAGLVVFTESIADSGILPWLPAVPLAVSLPLCVAVVFVVTVWACVRMRRSPCPRCGRVIGVDLRLPKPPLEFYSYVCEHCRVRWVTNVGPSD